MNSKSKQKMCEVARSFSYKLNLGNYQTCDFFCSQKAEVPENEAIKKSEDLHNFCKSEVIKSVNEYLSQKVNVEELRRLGDEWTKRYNQLSQLSKLKEEELEAKKLTEK